MGCVKAAAEGVLQGICSDEWNVKGAIQPTVTSAKVLGPGISAVIHSSRWGSQPGLETSSLFLMVPVWIPRAAMCRD